MHYSPVPMHIPDGFLSLVVSIICWVIYCRHYWHCYFTDK